MALSIARPKEDEFNPYYAGYIGRLPGDTDVLDALERQRAAMMKFVGSLGDEKANYRYGPDKWTVKEVIGHLIDAERVFSYRAMRIARNDTTPLPGFDEKAYVPAGEFHRRTLKDLGDEYDHVRRATIALARSMTPEMHARQGTANANPISVRALFWITAGHERHHWAILAERYGVTIPPM